MVQTITTGVPHEIILGPLLFVIYINDVFNIPKEANFIAYADDICIFITGNSVNHIIKSPNIVLKLLTTWSEVN